MLVGSVDAFQGSEREAIIVSMVRQGNYGDVCVCLRVCVCVWMRACVCVFSGTVIAAKRGCLCVCHFKPGLATFWGRCATTMIATLDFWRMSDAQTSPWSGQRCIFFCEYCVGVGAGGEKDARRGGGEEGRRGGASQSSYFRSGKLV